MDELVSTIEGSTSILVPREAINATVPPREPAFFNPRAKRNRDFSIVAYAAFVRKFRGEKIFLDSLSGLGARGLRVANEIIDFDRVVLNDINDAAIAIAMETARRNSLDNVEFSKEEVCRFLTRYSRRGERAAVVDLDPFGSPAAYLDCCIRATAHGGMISVTATDLQVLNGLCQDACARRYGGVSVRTEFSNEIAVRLMLGCLRQVAARMGMKFEPLAVESDQHYYRFFVRILSRRDVARNMGFVCYCGSCGERGVSAESRSECGNCGQSAQLAGPLWIGPLFEKEFMQNMAGEADVRAMGSSCAATIAKATIEAEMPATYYTLDEIAARTKSSPPRLKRVIEILRAGGFAASPTSLNPTGFRTDACIDEIKRIFA